MAVKSNRGNSSLKKNSFLKEDEVTKSPAKTKRQAEEGSTDFEDNAKTAKSGKKSIQAKDDDTEEEEDDVSFKKGEDDDENWDPDFDEFDLPKSSKKVAFGKKEAKDTDDEFKVDEEFEDYFNSSSKKKYNDADDDY